MTQTIEQLRREAVDEFGYCDLGDGELETLAKDLEESQQSLGVEQKTLEVMSAMLKRMEKLAANGNVNVTVDSEPLKKAGDAMAFAVGSMHDRIEKGLKLNEARFDALTKALTELGHKVAETAVRATNVEAPVVNVNVTELTASLAKIAQRTPERHDHVHKVAAPVVNVNGLNAVAKSITDALTMLSSRMPEVVVEGPGADVLKTVSDALVAGIVEGFRISRPKKAVQMMLRDRNNQIEGSEIEYEYEG